MTEQEGEQVVGSEYRPGQTALEDYMELQARVVAESMFLCFALGQAAAALAVEHPEIPNIIGILETDAADLRTATEELLEHVDSMVANARRNAGIDEPPAGGEEH